MSSVLAIETSCDETAVAVLQKEGKEIRVLADVIASQIDIHKETGGVVPNVAAREHARVIEPLVESVMEKAGITPDAIAVTVGPGLMPALLVGVKAARKLAVAWNKPLIPVHHLEGHIYSALLPQVSPTNYKLQTTNFPALALIVSGGHTMLIRIDGHLQYKVLGQTRDDAAGEVFDKVGRMLDLPYPGGPEISKLAKEGDPAAFDFPRPMKHSGDLDFSFSGLKTAVLYTLRDLDPSSLKLRKASIAASFQQAVVDSLTGKVRQALKQEEYSTVLLAGGVAANQLLRQEMQVAADEAGIPLLIAPLDLCGDNAVMIGQVGLLALEAGRTISASEIDASARVSIEKFVGSGTGV